MTVAQFLETGSETQPHLGAVLHRPFRDHRLDVGDDRRGDQRMAVPGAARVPAIALEDLRHLGAGDDAAHGQDAAVHPLPDRHYVRPQAVVELVAEPLAQPAEAADHLVVDPQDPVPGGELPAPPAGSRGGP